MKDKLPAPVAKGLTYTADDKASADALLRWAEKSGIFTHVYNNKHSDNPWTATMKGAKDTVYIGYGTTALAALCAVQQQLATLKL